MSWSDDTRCLFCDGRLPLYRKITHGQFCSNAHRKSYWQDQEKLAVERLSQTHSSLKAFRLAVTAAAVPEAPPVYPEVPVVPAEAADPRIASLVPQAWIPPVAVLPGMVAADPLEYEMFSQPSRLSRNPVATAMQPRLADSIRGWADFSAWHSSGPTTARETAPFEWDGDLQRPKLGLLPVLEASTEALSDEVSQEDPPYASRTAIPWSSRNSDGPVWSVEALEPMLPPVTHLDFQIPPDDGDVFLELLDALTARPDQLFSLPYLTACAGGPWALCRPQDPQAVETEPHTLVSRGDTTLQFLPAAPMPAEAALVGLPIRGVRVANDVFRAEPRALDARSEALAAQIILQTTSRDLSLRMASSQFAFPVLPEDVTVVPELAAVELAGPAVAIPELRASLTPLAGVRSAFTTLTALPYGKGAPWCGASAGSMRTGSLFPQHPTPAPLIPQLRLQPIDAKATDAVLASISDSKSAESAGLMPPPKAQHPPVWSHAVDFWKHAPRDLKLLLFAIPALIALAFHPSLPKVSLAAPQTASNAPSEFRKVINDQWSSLKKSVLDRAAIALNEDFRSGLDDWASPGGSTTSWSFDQTGFVRPGPLALYRPSVGLTDYQVQFLGMIDKKAMSWVVRAADFDNYYVIKMVVLKPGPIPTLGITRYAVVHGKAQNRVDTPVQIDARADTLYRVLVDIHGDTFTLEIQGQTIDSWSEPRLARGGVGFFSASGEESRVRWVQVMHQYDMLGRLCAYLAPYNIPSTTGSWQP